MSHAQREGLVISALMHTAATPHGDELRRYVLDFDCAGLCADNGKALVSFIKGVVDPERREHNTPALSDKLQRIFDGWQQANNTADYVAAYKAEYLSQLKHRCLFARDIFACRFVFRLLEMWQSFVATYDPQTVAYANPLGIKVRALLVFIVLSFWSQRLHGSDGAASTRITTTERLMW